MCSGWHSWVSVTGKVYMTHVHSEGQCSAKRCTAGKYSSSGFGKKRPILKGMLLTFPLSAVVGAVGDAALLLVDNDIDDTLPSSVFDATGMLEKFIN